MATFIDPVDVSPSTLNTFVDIDVSAHVPVTATGVMVRIVNTAAVTTLVFVRPNGSTSWPTLELEAGTHTMIQCGVVSQIFEIYSDNAGLIFYIEGFFESDAEFYINPPVVSTNVASTWTDVDISTYTSGAPVAAMLVVNSTNYNLKFIGHRVKGSTDNFSNAPYGGAGMIVGVDASQTYQEYQSWAGGCDVWLMGVILSDYVPHVNRINRALATTGAYTNLPALPAGAIGASYYIDNTAPATNRKFNLRKEGASRPDLYYKLRDASHLISELNSSQICEGKIESTNVDFWEIGYFEGVVVGATTITASDLLSNTITDSSTNLLLSSLGDNLATSITDSSASVLLSSVVDVCDLNITEEVQSISVVLSSADIITAAIFEAQDSVLLSSRSDALTIAIAESVSIYSMLTSADNLNLSITESINLLCSLAANDSVNMSVAEGLVNIAAVLQVADSLNLSITDASQAVFVLLAGTDYLSTSIIEAVEILSRLDRADSLNYSITEAVDLLCSLAASDATSMSVTEGLVNIAAVLQVADSLNLSITDASQAVFVLLVRSDELNISLTDISAILARLDRSDSVDISIDDQAQVLNFLSALDSLNASITDAALKQAIGTVIARLSAKLRIYPTLSAKLKNHPTLSGKPKVN